MTWTPGTTAEYLDRWNVGPLIPTLSTPSSEVTVGLHDGAPVVLKVARIEEESRGSALLAAWQDRGAVPVLRHDDRAVLMRRATGTRDLARMAASGEDRAATEAICALVTALHAQPSPVDLPGLVPLDRWFRELVDPADPLGDPFLDRAADVARALLAATAPGDVRALHGDVHHGNVLDLGDRFVVIDPKGLLGHRLFDVANLFCNPDPETAAARLDHRLETVAHAMRLDRRHVAAWTAAWCGLSTVWVRSSGASSWHAGTPALVGQRLLSLL